MLLAYKYVAVAAMLAEVNYCADRLELPMKLPVAPADLREHGVLPPTKFRKFGGRVDTADYSFSFPGTPRLRFVTKPDPFNGLSVREQNRTLYRAPCLIGTNQAYQLATNWLWRLSVDVRELELTNSPEVRQRSFRDTRVLGKENLLPIFEARWGKWDDPKVMVSIDGRNRGLLTWREEDESFSTRPAELIRDQDELLRIPDEDFLKLSPQERAALVSRFALATNAVAEPWPPTMPMRRQDRPGQQSNHKSAYEKHH